jgi:carbon-monoxide dehydrogenase medium subunit
MNRPGTGIDGSFGRNDNSPEEWTVHMHDRKSGCKTSRRGRWDIAMKDFGYLAPRSLEEAIDFLGREGAVPLAGGTDLLVAIKRGTPAPRWMVDVTGIGLDQLDEAEDALLIGATSTHARVLASGSVRSRFLALAEALASIGSPQIRNLATIGGNICYAVPSADSAPPLLVLGAEVQVMGPDGGKNWPLEEFFVGPRRTTLVPGEIVTAIRVPLPVPGTATAFLKAGRRRAMSLAVVNVAVSISRAADEVTIGDIRIALGAVAPIPVRAYAAERLLRGRAYSADLAGEAGIEAARTIAPISDLRATAQYRYALSSILVKRAIVKAWERASALGRYRDA